MRLYRGQIPTIAEEMTQSLIKEGHIEVLPEYVVEVNLDIEASLKEYNRRDRQLLERAKDMVSARNLDYSHTGRIRQTLADREKFGIGDKAYEYVIRQHIEVLMHSRNVEEIYAEDKDLRLTMRNVLRRYAGTDRDLDRQVRARIKNLQEGTTNWEVEYERVMGDLRSSKRLN